MLKKLLLFRKSALLSLGLASAGFAQQETSTLPQGIFRTWVLGGFGSSNQKFNSRGRREGLAHILNRSITIQDLVTHMKNSKSPDIIKDAEQLESLRNELNTIAAMTGRDPLGDNLYQADIYADTQANASQLVGVLEYGLTDKVSLGLGIPLRWYDIRTTIRIEYQNTFQKAINAIKNSAEMDDGIRDFAPRAQNSESFKKTLFTDAGYKTPGHTRIFGLGDIEGGLKYRAYESQHMDAALSLGFRLPTASHHKDVTDLADIPTGDRQLDLSLQAGFDFKFNPNLILYSGAQFTLQTPDNEPVVGYLKGAPEASLPDLNDARVHDASARRKLGNTWDLTLSLRQYLFQRRIAVIGAYLYQYKYADRYDGFNPHLDYNRIAGRVAESYAHAGEVFLVYSTVADYMRQQQGIPWEVLFSYHHTLGGRNASDSNYAFARLNLFFK